MTNVDVSIPHNKLSVITGLSGCGKSSLAFDTIFAEGQRRYIDTFSSYTVLYKWGEYVYLAAIIFVENHSDDFVLSVRWLSTLSLPKGSADT